MAVYMTQKQCRNTKHAIRHYIAHHLSPSIKVAKNKKLLNKMVELKEMEESLYKVMEKMDKYIRKNQPHRARYE